MKNEDQRKFEDVKNKVPVEAFTLFYKKKSDYVQIGKGYGFFHIDKDTANLGTEKFDAEFTLRLRAKSYDNHYPVCSKCKIRYKSRTKICKKCGNHLKSDFPLFPGANASLYVVFKSSVIGEAQGLCLHHPSVP